MLTFLTNTKKGFALQANPYVLLPYRMDTFQLITIFPQFCRASVCSLQVEAADSLTLPTGSSCLPMSVFFTFSLSRKKERKRKQAVRSLGRLGSPVTRRPPVVYQPASLAGILITLGDGRTYLGFGFALRCLQRLSLLDIAIQLWGRPPNWRTSGQAISVLSYWR